MINIMVNSFFVRRAASLAHVQGKESLNAPDDRPDDPPEPDANYLIDNKAGIIVDAEGSRANRAVEIAVTQTMVERVRRRFDLRPQRLAGDSVYGAVRLLKWLVERNIDQGHIVYYRANQNDCSICSLKAKCTTAVGRAAVLVLNGAL